MKMYLEFLKEGLVYWREKARVFCSAFYVVYSAPMDVTTVTIKRSRISVKEYSLGQHSVKSFEVRRIGFTPVFGNGFAV